MVAGLSQKSGHHGHSRREDGKDAASLVRREIRFKVARTGGEAHLFTRPDLITPQFEALIAMYDKGDVKRMSIAASTSPKQGLGISTFITARRGGRSLVP
jgi:hypothetical protein